MRRLAKNFLATLLPLAMWGVSGGGWAGDGVVALQTATPSCADKSRFRYVDCGNGTVTDNATGLVWLKQAYCLARCSGNGEVCAVDGDCPFGDFCDIVFTDWYTAMEFVAGLSDKPATSVAAREDCGLSDGSSAGEWRLPSVEEWEAMIAHAVALGCSPPITNDLGNACWDEACFAAGDCSFARVGPFYWSSTTSISRHSWAWSADFQQGHVTVHSKHADLSLWPVRGGQ